MLVFAWLLCVVVKNVGFSMDDGLSCNLSARLQCVVVKNVGFSMDGLSCGQKYWFQQGWSITLVSAWMDLVGVKHIGFSMASMCFAKKKCRFQHG
jgi:hypothetical protein